MVPAGAVKTLTAALMRNGYADAYNPTKSFILNNVNESASSSPNSLGVTVNAFSRFTAPLLGSTLGY